MLIDSSAGSSGYFPKVGHPHLGPIAVRAFALNPASALSQGQSGSSSFPWLRAPTVLGRGPLAVMAPQLGGCLATKNWWKARFYFIFFKKPNSTNLARRLVLLGIDIPSRLPSNQNQEPSRRLRTRKYQSVWCCLNESPLSGTIELVTFGFMTLVFENMHAFR